MTSHISWSFLCLITFLGDYFMLQYFVLYFILKDFESQASSIIRFPAFTPPERALLRAHSFFLPSCPPKKENDLNTKTFLLGK